MGGRGRWLSHEGGGRDGRGRGRSHHSWQQRLSVRWSGVHPSILPFLPPPCGRGASASVSFIPSFLCGLPPSPHRRRRRRRRRRRPTSTLSKQGVCPSVRPSLARAPPLLSVLRPPSGEEDRFYKWRNESVSVLLPKRARARFYRRHAAATPVAVDVDDFDRLLRRQYSDGVHATSPGMVNLI